MLQQDPKGDKEMSEGLRLTWEGVRITLEINQAIRRAKARNPAANVRPLLRRWGYEGERRIYAPLGVRRESEGEIGEIPRDVPVVVFGNHCFSSAFFGVNIDLFDHFPDRPLVLVLKQGPWITRWFFARPLELAGMILLDRNGDGKDIEKIRSRARAENGSKGAAAPVFWLMWDGHRPRAKRIQGTRCYLHDLGIPWANEIRYAQVGYPGGILALQEALPEDTAWVELTSSFDRWPTGPKDFHPTELRGAILHTHWERVARPPIDRAALKAYAVDRCRMTNDRIDDWIGE